MIKNYINEKIVVALIYNNKVKMYSKTNSNDYET